MTKPPKSPRRSTRGDGPRRTGEPAAAVHGGLAFAPPVATSGSSLAVKAGADGVLVSNHGGRATETGRATIECLPEVVQGVGGKIPVLIDGGVRRGTDVFKALALGATAVGIGRPYIWGLGAFGQAGVERTMQILNTELRLAMVGCGTTKIADISAKSLIDTRRI